MNTARRVRSKRSGINRGKNRAFSGYGARRGKPSRAGSARPFGKRPFRSTGNRGGRKMPTFNPSQFINTNPTDLAPSVYIPKHKFDTFGLDTRLVENIASLRMSTPTPIQDQIIPEILSGRDVIALAETGTGKTAAFLVPLIEKTLKEKRRQTLILTPTRELALQIDEELRKLSRGLHIFSTTCVGGINIGPQIRALRRDNHFVIGTPGRLLDLIKRKNYSPQGVTTVVLDEADRMLDMGFIPDIKSIISYTPKERETLLFSATIVSTTRELANNFLKNPITVSVKKREVINSIEQDIVSYGYHDKFETLTNLLKGPEFKRVLIFGAMKHSVKKLALELSANSISAESIHGNKTHGQRQHALNKFKRGDVRVLVATDVAARGIHVDNVTHVINYDLPNTFEDYVHRIGRTGRATKRGKALTFVVSGGSRR